MAKNELYVAGDIDLLVKAMMVDLSRDLIARRDIKVERASGDELRAALALILHDKVRSDYIWLVGQYLQATSDVYSVRTMAGLPGRPSDDPAEHDDAEPEADGTGGPQV